MNEHQTSLLRELQKENPWWSSGLAPQELIREFRRADFYVYSNKLIDKEYPNVIIGPRRIGKSTVLYQLIDFLIEEKKIDSKRIIFLSLERPFFATIKNPIKQALELFQENILKEPLESLSKEVFVFLDEASRSNEWALQVKEFFDRKYKVRFFITGSSSPALFDKTTESLVGRHTPSIMLTLKFRDVIKLINDEKANECLTKLRKSVIRHHFSEAIRNNNPDLLFKALQSRYIAIGSTGETILQIMLNKYLLRGGYPEFYDKKTDWKQASKVMREAYFDAIISYDMVRVFKSRNPDKIRQLYVFLSAYTAQQVNIANLSREMGISRTAIDEYLSQLQQTYLIKIMRPYKKNKLKISNDLKKIYVCDVGLRNAVMGVTEEEINDPILLGRLAETVAQDHTLRLNFCIDEGGRCENFFWKSDREVDILAEFFGKSVPIESKYAEKIRSEDIQELKKAIKSNNSPFGVLLTKNSFKFDPETKIISLPLWLYLVMC